MAGPAVEKVSKQESAASQSIAAVLPALRRVDRLLERAMRTVAPERASDVSARFRGLFLTREDITHLLTREPGSNPFGQALEFREDCSGGPATADAPLAWLIRSFGLDGFDSDLVILALAPEVDLRYERIYAYLQDDVTRKRPTIELALNLLCSSAEDKLERQNHFLSNAPLLRNGLLSLVADPNQVEPPYLARYLKLDEQIVRIVLGQNDLDPRIEPFCKILQPAGSLESLQLPQILKRGLGPMLRRAWSNGEPLCFYLRDASKATRQDLARALGVQVNAHILCMDLERALACGAAIEQTLRVFFREARFRRAIAYLDGLGAIQDERHFIPMQSAMTMVNEHPAVAFLGGGEGWVSTPHGAVGVIEVSLGGLDFEARRAHWQVCLEQLGTRVEQDDLDHVANRFQLDCNQISEASAMARNFAMLRAAGEAEHEIEVADKALTRAELFAAARAQSGHQLAALARKIEPVYTWKDIVLPENTLAQLREICARVEHHHRVFGEWGFGRKLSHGKGVNALFAGASGCGKTMAAEIIANELQLDLYKIDLAGVVSKYIGETEKNLDRIFKAAENANAILFFDEADALFGKRSEVHDSHDRYANIEVSYLLQKMEEYEGIAILATNMRQHLDEAFIRRLAFTVLFPFPREEDRRRIWSGVWPAEMPLSDSLDFEYFAGRFKLSGGNIKNVALAAAFLAASDGSVVTMDHLFHATGREYEKMGKSLTDAELYGGLARITPAVTGKGAMR